MTKLNATQQLVLNTLAACPPHGTAKEMAGVTGKSTATVRRAFKALVKAGRIESAKPRGAYRVVVARGRTLASVELATVDGEAKLYRKPAPEEEAKAVPKAERADVLLAVLKAGERTLTPHEAADHLRLTGTFRAQQAVAALTSLVKRGLVTKVRSGKVTHYELAAE